MTPSSAPQLVPAGHGVAFSLLGMPSRKLLGSADTGGIYQLVEQQLPPGLGVPPHVHTREDEVFFVLDGEVEFVIADTTVIARAGDVVHAPRDVPHAYRGAGDRPASIRFLVTPPQCEPMFDELSHLPLPPDPAVLAEICARYGITLIP